jgi:hypothetical protein
MRRSFLSRLIVIPLLSCCLQLVAADKPRLLVLTDIGDDPDDQMSMVRLMTYTNHLDIEGLVATPPGGTSRPVQPDQIRRIVAAYGKVRDNLELHEPGFPTESYLLERIVAGLPLGDMEAVGQGKDSPGSELLINAADRDDPRPLWVAVWGGRYELYTPRTEKWFLEPETRPIWTNVQDEVLGNDSQWHTTNHATLWRWREAYQNDFAARMDWTIKPYKGANHPPVVKLGHPAELSAKSGERVDLSAEGTTDPGGDLLSFHWFCYEEPGTRRMSNSRTGVKHDIVGFDQPKADLMVKTGRVMAPGPGTMHLILAVTDHGTPRLTRYRRVIITVAP